MEFTKRDLPKKSENLSEWYTRVILLSELADYGPAKGTMIYRPYGFAIWELIQKDMDARIKARGVENAYFPLFIPESLLAKEAAHVKGFSPELAVVTIGGGKELEEKLAIRPTSETIMYEAYARWVHSWRDLPMQINQWNNVVRWEKRTYLFLRTTEFLWQEGHTAHGTHEEAWETVRWAMGMYKDVYNELFALPGHIGRKSEAEKFAGADVTLTYESLMPEGKALQSSTAHDLGQNFSKTFGITFLDKEGASQYAWQTSWGLSTRSIGGLIMAHGDDNGLRLPPRLAPVQVIILPVRMEDQVLNFCHEIKKVLVNSGVRAVVDGGENDTFGSKINKWELKGVPLRFEIGTKEVEAKTVTAVRRDTREKSSLSAGDLSSSVLEILENIQKDMHKEQEEFLRLNTREVSTYDDFKNTLAEHRGFISAFWCERAECEEKIKEETKATTRCLPIDSMEESGRCIYCGETAKHKWLFGQAY